MKKLVVIVSFSLATGGLTGIPLASAQSPASPSSESAAATPSSSPAAASTLESVTVNSNDSDRVATATSIRPGSEAFVDLNRVFKESNACRQQMSALQDKIRKFDQQCKEQQAQIVALDRERAAESDSSRRLQLEQELANSKAKLQAQVVEVKQQFLQVEAQHYHEAYELVRSTTAEYAKQHGIRVVHRAPSIGYADDKDDNVDITDRKAVLARVNRPVIYSDGPSEIPTDITDAIIHRLNDTKSR